jgi:putative ABC transport system ATP-binding protein
MPETRNQYIIAKQLSRLYQRGNSSVTALSEASFSVPQGQVVGLVGPSGAGKSTLLNILGGLDRPDSGTVQVGGTELTGLSGEQLASFRRHRVGFVFQEAHLVPAYTVYENVMLPLVPMELPLGEKTRLVQAALEAANIEHRADHLPGELSGGEQQRAAVARAVVNDPELILADEPTGELDAENATRVMDLLLSLDQGRARTIIIASHDAAALARAERILHIDNGVLGGIEDA